MIYEGCTNGNYLIVTIVLRTIQINYFTPTFDEFRPSPSSFQDVLT